MVPKRRFSKMRTRSRRSQQDKVKTLKPLGECENCGEPKQSHRVCLNCGHYRGRQVLPVTAV
jgi:large subunit ribosomal protein L32